MKPAVPRETPSDELTVALPVATGVIAVGPYKPGVEYTLPRAEAERLVAVKGFEIVNAVATATTTED